MIVFRGKILKEYSINPYTAEITDSNGVVQETYLHQGRETFKKMKVYKIVADTYLGYNLNKVIHHMDFNPHNNALSNLCLMTPEEHNSLHHKGKKLSEETKKRMSEAMTGNKHALGKKYSEEARERLSESHKGLHMWNNGERNTWSKECPEGFVKGRLKRNK